jgi:hypothetical protein
MNAAACDPMQVWVGGMSVTGLMQQNVILCRCRLGDALRVCLFGAID